MAGSLPQIEVPTEQADALPTTVLPLPTPGAFGAGVGQGLETSGGELFQEGFKAYHVAAEALAQQKENDFQKTALQISARYRNLYLGDAVAGHTAASDALDNAYKQAVDSLPSKYGTALFKSNASRTSRIVQELMDNHFEGQEKANRSVQNKIGENGDAAMVASLAVAPLYSGQAVEDVISARKDRALDFATKQGMDPESAEAFSKNAAFKLTDALFKTLFDPHSAQPHELIKAELEKYSKLGLVDAGRLESSQRALAGTESDAWVSKTMAGFIPQDADRKPDPRGHIASADVQAAIDGIDKTDPLREKKIDNLYKEVALRHHSDVSAGAELEGVVRRQMQANGGKIPEKSQDWQDYRRLYPTDAAKLEDRVSDRAYRKTRQAVVTEKQANDDAFGSARYYMSQLTVDQAKQLTPATIDKLVHDSYSGQGGGASPATLARAQEYAKKVQTEKLDPVEKQFNFIASQALESAYKGDMLKTRANMSRAHAEMTDLYDESKAKGKPLTATELRDQLVVSFTKPGFLQKPPGESYQSRPSDARMGKDGNWYVPRGKNGGWVPYTSAGN